MGNLVLNPCEIAEICCTWPVHLLLDEDTMVFEGNSIEIDAVVVWRIVGGKLAEAWEIPAVHAAHPMRAET